MKYIVAPIFLLCSLNALAINYYISPTGLDSRTAAQAQNIATPWLTLVKAWSVLVAGDTVFCRGGTYPTLSGSQNFSNRSGTAAQRICITRYQLEAPIFTWGGASPTSQVRCFNFSNVNFIHLRGLRITNILQGPSQGSYNYGISMNSNDNNNIIEFCEADHIGGTGIQVGAGCNGNLLKNCDSHHNGDPFSSPAYENSNGYELAQNVFGVSTTLTGCRAWWNGDDGFDGFNGQGAHFYDSCWSFWNGYVPGTFTTAGNGQGFKGGPTPVNHSSVVLRTFTRCISVHNRQFGWTQNFSDNSLTFQSILYNCTAANNGNAGFYYGSPYTEVNTLKNNLVYNNGGGGQAGAINSQSVQANNSWNPATAVTVNAADFVSVTETGLDAARQSDGTLPVMTFLHLASGSDLINKGVNVGLSFNGTAPDLGAFETGGTTPPPTLTASSSFTPIACNGGNSTVTVTANGGVPPYTGTGNFTRAAGTYTFTVTDQVGTQATTTITVTQPSAITITQSSTSITINGGTATTTVTASGGASGYTYKLDAGSFQASNSFTGVAAGTHTITVRDANACTNTLTYTLTQPTALLVSAAATVNPLLCFGNTTTITVTASGGTPAYQYQINGGSFGASNTFTNRGAGTYTLGVRDAGGAITSVSLTITQPTQITISQSSGTILINGGTTTTTVTASGGTGTKNYKLDAGSFQVSNVFTGVAAGTHTITVRDANLCTNTLTYTLTQPSALSATAAGTVNPLLCFGATTTITVTATGGTTPYTYSINGGTFQSSNLFTGRGAGTYNLTVKDAALATFTVNLTITQPTQIAITESHTTIAVNGGTSTVTITASGGTGTKNYSMDGGTFQSSNVFAGILAGNHTVTVRDANLCTNTLTFSITQPTALVVSSSVTTAIACNAGSGTITVVASGGTPAYSYRNGSGTPQASGVFSGLTAGTYNFTVTDGGGAIGSTTTTITQPTAISVAVAFGAAPATVTVTASGGVGTLNYRLDAGSYQASNVFSSVAAGNHTVTVRDGNLCTATKSFTVGASLAITAITNTINCNGGTAQITIGATGGTPPYTGPGIYFQSAGTTTYTVTDNAGATHDTTIVLTQPTAISASESHTSIVANGGTSTVTVTASGGVGTKTYSRDGGSYQGSNVFAGVLAGNHTVTVKDNNNCTVTISFTITQPGTLGISLVVGTAIACNAGTTTVTVTGSGGTIPYTYGKNGTFQSPQLFSSVTAGTYTFSVKDQFSNQKDTIITITEPSALLLSVTTGTILTNGGNTTVTATGSGGTGGLTYRIDGGSYQGTGNFSGITAGSHVVTVKDANNCTNTNTFTILEPGALNISVVIGAAIACNGGTTSATVSATGGTTPYTGTGVTTQSAGTITFTVTDAFGAQADTIITISQPSAITASVSTGTIVVNGGTTTATVTASGGTGGMTYQLDGGAFQGSNIFAGVAAGNHTIVTKDANACTTSTAFNITQPGVLNISVSYSAISCNAGSTNVTVGATGGTSPYTGTGVTSKTAGTYTFSVVDALGATHDTIVTITQPNAVIVDSVIAGTIATYGGTTSIIVYAQGGTGSLTYQLDGGSFQSSSTITGVGAGNHTVTVKDANNCTGTYNFTMTQPPAPSAGFYLKKRRARHIYIQL